MSGEALTAAVLTPAGRGAVASVRVSGDDARRVVAELFRPASGRRFDELPIDAIVFGRWTGEPGEELVAASRSSSVVEVHCHGGQAAVNAVLASLGAAGCSIVEWQTALDDSLNPIQRDATLALARATTWRTTSILLDQRDGALSRAIQNLTERVDLLSIVGGDSVADGTAPGLQPSVGDGVASYNHSQGEPVTRESILAEIDTLLARARIGLHLVEPFTVVIAGEPNVGKSSLINAIVGYERAIVFDQPGTTRDVVTALTAIDGWPVELSDTAGLRESSDPLEAAGIERARRQIEAADLVIHVTDATRPNPPLDVPNALHVRNKCDLVANLTPAGTLDVSALTGQGIDKLVAKIACRLVRDVLQPGDAVPFTTEQSVALNAARHLLAAQNIPRALDSLRALLAAIPSR